MSNTFQFKKCELKGGNESVLVTNLEYWGIWGVVHGRQRAPSQRKLRKL